MIQPTRVLQLAKEKSQKLLSLDSERFTCKLEKFLTVYHGYSKLKPKIFPKRMSAMFPATVVVAAGEGQTARHFHPGFGSTASLKRHQMDWSEKYQRTRPAYAESPTGRTMTTTTATRASETDRSRRLHVVNGSAEVQEARRKPYGASTIVRGRRSPRRVVLRTNSGPDASAEIVCSSAVLTYREGLFYHDKCDANCTEV